jgi:hypothetical protein
MTHPSPENPYAAPVSPLPETTPDGPPVRSLAAWGVRYTIVGAVLGLVLSVFVFPGTAESVPFKTVGGAIVGCVIGCLGGAVDYGTRRLRRDKSITSGL